MHEVKYKNNFDIYKQSYELLVNNTFGCKL